MGGGGSARGSYSVESTRLESPEAEWYAAACEEEQLPLHPSLLKSTFRGLFGHWALCRAITVLISFQLPVSGTHTK